jgi:hypothetical protein
MTTATFRQRKKNAIQTRPLEDQKFVPWCSSGFACLTFSILILVLYMFHLFVPFVESPKIWFYASGIGTNGSVAVDDLNKIHSNCGEAFVPHLSVRLLMNNRRGGRLGTYFLGPVLGGKKRTTTLVCQSCPLEIDEQRKRFYPPK